MKTAGVSAAVASCLNLSWFMLGAIIPYCAEILLLNSLSEIQKLLKRSED